MLSSPFYTAGMRFFCSVVGFPNMKSDIAAKQLYLYLYVLTLMQCLALYSGSAFIDDHTDNERPQRATWESHTPQLLRLKQTTAFWCLHENVSSMLHPIYLLINCMSFDDIGWVRWKQLSCCYKTNPNVKWYYFASCMFQNILKMKCPVSDTKITSVLSETDECDNSLLL